MAIRNLSPCIDFNSSELALLNHLKPFASGTWEGKFKGKVRGSKTELKNLIKSARKSLQKNHGLFCAFCGLTLHETSGDEIDHIAPKGKYPEFTFVPDNLVLSCSLCNGFTKKGEYDSIEVYSINYNTCIFSLVHPYYDDVTNHYEFIHTDQGVPAIIKLLTKKAKESNRIFKLDSPHMTDARVKLGLHKIYPNTANDNNLIEQILQMNRTV